MQQQRAGQQGMFVLCIHILCSTDGSKMHHTVEPSNAPRTLVLNQQAMKQRYNYATHQQEEGNFTMSCNPYYW